jgi:hypothetical protein
MMLNFVVVLLVSGVHEGKSALTGLGTPVILTEVAVTVVAFVFDFLAIPDWV